MQFTRDYLQRFDRELGKSKDSAQLIQTMQQQYPDTGLGIALELGAKVSLGEVDW